MKRKRPSKSLAGKTSLRGTGCLSAKDSGVTRKRSLEIAGSEDWREMQWLATLKADMERAEQYFWRQTAERRVIYRNFVASASRLWRGNDFCFGKKSC